MLVSCETLQWKSIILTVCSAYDLQITVKLKQMAFFVIAVEACKSALWFHCLILPFFECGSFDVSRRVISLLLNL